jgi:hypothetical protein
MLPRTYGYLDAAVIAIACRTDKESGGAKRMTGMRVGKEYAITMFKHTHLVTGERTIFTA